MDDHTYSAVQKHQRIYESSEDYLETILILQERNGSVRSVDVANEMNFSKPSISVAMKKLRAHGYVEVADDGTLILTDSGREIAENIYSRHTLLTTFFVALGVDEETAAEDACRVEHDLSEMTFQKIREHAEHLQIYQKKHT